MAMSSSGWCACSIAAASITVGACGLDWTVPEETGGSTGIGAGHGAGNGGSTSQSATTASAGGMAGAGATGQEGGEGGATASSSPASSSTGPQPMCDDQPTCETCDNCAINGPCEQYFNNCQADLDCSYLDGCVYGNCASLGDVGCIDACYYDFPDGAPLFDMMIGCVVCDVCDDTCLAFQTLWNC